MFILFSKHQYSSAAIFEDVLKFGGYTCLLVRLILEYSCCHNSALYCKDKCTEFICSIVSLRKRKEGRNGKFHLSHWRKISCALFAFLFISR